MKWLHYQTVRWTRYIAKKLYRTITRFLVSDSTCSNTSQALPCSTTSFLDHGIHARGNGFLMSFPNSDWWSCKHECENEYLCRGFMFHSGTCSLSSSDLNPLTLTFAQCQELWYIDGACAGYTYSTDYEKCLLSNDKDSMITDCASCRFYEKTCQSCTYYTLLTIILYACCLKQNL